MTVLPAVLLAVTVSPIAADVPLRANRSSSPPWASTQDQGRPEPDPLSVCGSSSDTRPRPYPTSGSQGKVTSVATGAATITATSPSASIEGSRRGNRPSGGACTRSRSSRLRVSVAQFRDRQFTATGDLDLGTPESDRLGHLINSDTYEATISRQRDHEGLATVWHRDVIITATDPSSGLSESTLST